MFVGGLGQGDVGAVGGSRIRVVGSAGRSRSPLDQAVGGASGRSDLRLGRRTAQLTRRELRPPVPDESATWQAGGEFDCGVSERGEWWAESARPRRHGPELAPPTSAGPAVRTFLYSFRRAAAARRWRAVLAARSRLSTTARTLQ